MGTHVKCPICHKPLTKNAASKKLNPFYPFCCEPCKLIDLGKWLDGEYGISDSLLPDESLNAPEENAIKGEEEPRIRTDAERNKRKRNTTS
ncbi:MAG: DNA gyrase inhibitor YacG [Planctomycetota bacterium]|nr:MAG: DNA gyrase inhibitor YacG [Planctomycetota bacterium]